MRFMGGGGEEGVGRRGGEKGVVWFGMGLGRGVRILFGLWVNIG